MVAIVEVSCRCNVRCALLIAWVIDGGQWAVVDVGAGGDIHGVCDVRSADFKCGIAGLELDFDCDWSTMNRTSHAACKTRERERISCISNPGCCIFATRRGGVVRTINSHCRHE